jgi:hypothetical protein
VAGHNHVSVVEVLGIDKFRRLGGTLEVTPEAIRKAMEWEHRNAKRVARRDVKVIDCYRKLGDIKIDGSLSDWEGIEPTQLMTDDYAQIHGIAHNASFRITYDDTNLYAAYETRNMGPLRNSGNQWDRLFKSGAAVDLQLGMDPAADPGRREAVAGDLRLLMTYMGRRPVAVVYRPVAPGAAGEEAWEVVSPVWKMSFDSVKILDDVRMAHSGSGRSYVVEAAIPLKAIGLRIQAGVRLKLDWGALATDDDGTAVLSRNYWANKATAILSDAPSEAALHPDLWGYVRFFGRTRQGLRMAEPKDLLGGGEGGEDDITLELEEE